ncbi:cysteine desulfurase [Butyrivibrio sp. Su6]|uniref:cysteine desulfurase family protein n=1 Tax=Butyrivibrio sp. Su6 TaxID=1520810 RepID=UPI00089E7B8D|nr:cysteine desulfurase family protein [Butyrivibrio sp. Su6]SEF62368.1 cysteine desulfurase [Butyrivibrio sp. Su6]
MGIYLDYNATTPIDKRVLDYMVEVYTNNYGNADSRTHDYGDGARKIVEKARKEVASLLGVDSTEVFFTSGSTESSNIAIRGLISYANTVGKKHVITTSIEHKAVLETVKSLKNEGFLIDIVDPEKDGRISAQKIIDLVREDTLLVSVMHANNETGVIQPIEEIGEALAEKGVFFHVDATQSCGKLVEELRSTKYTMLSLSAHKFNGPQGVGALVLRKKRYKLPPVKAITYGGQQEHGIRPGTIPVALVAGLGKACEIANAEHEKNLEHCLEIKKEVLNLVENSGLEYTLNGNQDYCMPNTINVSFRGIESEALMLSSKQFCGISNGSACTSNDYKPSYVLTAMGIDKDAISSAIRISWGANSEISSVRDNILELLEIAKTLAF